MKLRFVPFTTRTSSRVLAEPTTAAASVIERAALEAFERFSPRAVRLVGVRAELSR